MINVISFLFQIPGETEPSYTAKSRPFVRDIGLEIELVFVFYHMLAKIQC